MRRCPSRRACTRGAGTRPERQPRQRSELAVRLQIAVEHYLERRGWSWDEAVLEALALNRDVPLCELKSALAGVGVKTARH
jgi:hypothetical protein